MRIPRLAAVAAAVASAVVLARCSGTTPSGPSGGGGGGGGGGGPMPTTAVINAAGDIGECGFGALQTGTMLDSLTGDLLVLGDLAYPTGSAADFRNCYDPAWGRHKTRSRPVPGNHEYETDPLARGYYDYFGSQAGVRGAGYYAFDEGSWRVIALNDNIPFGPGTQQYQWLRDELENNRQDCTLAYWHKPLFSSGPNGTNNDGAAGRVFWTTLMEFGVDVVLNGHDHLYERFAPQDADGRPSVNGIREFVAGTGGARSYAVVTPKANSEMRISAYGILTLQLVTGGYSWEFKSANNTSSDRGSGACHK